jgi:hypothetical protein
VSAVLGPKTNRKRLFRLIRDWMKKGQFSYKSELAVRVEAVIPLNPECFNYGLKQIRLICSIFFEYFMGNLLKRVLKAKIDPSEIASNCTG